MTSMITGERQASPSAGHERVAIPYAVTKEQVEEVFIIYYLFILSSFSSASRADTSPLGTRPFLDTYVFFLMPCPFPHLKSRLSAQGF
jgi:hypothetical protein